VPERSRDRVLSHSEIATLWRGLPATRFGDIARLLLLTAQRRQEIAELTGRTRVVGTSVEFNLCRGPVYLQALATKCVASLLRIEGKNGAS
jgi:hypothetical protein